MVRIRDDAAFAAIVVFDAVLMSLPFCGVLVDDRVRRA